VYYFWYPLGEFIYAFLNIFWISVICLGPGRPPRQLEQQSELFTPLAQTLDVGKHCKERPFDSSDGWCSRCEHWKPALAHHCRKCDRCALWQDHHCNFIGVCIGFRNMRSFFGWLFYAFLVLAYLVLLTARRLVIELLGRLDVIQLVPLPVGSLFGFDLPVCGTLLALATWLGVIAIDAKALYNQAKPLVWPITIGMPSGILGLKMSTVVKDARMLVGTLRQACGRMTQMDPERNTMIHATRQLDAAIGQVRLPTGPYADSVWGPFAGEKPWSCIEAVFGSPCSWRWWLPFVPGGTGDPIRPTPHPGGISLAICEAWANLSTVLQQANEVLAKRLWAEGEYARTVQRMLAEG